LVQIFSSAPCSQTLSVCLCFPFNVGDQVLHPYWTTGKIIVLYILIFMFLDNRWVCNLIFHGVRHQNWN
jgi:hypothetical protein